MNLTVSPQMRIVALVGLLALLGLGMTAFMLGRNGSSSSSSSSPAEVKAHSVPAKKPTAATRPAPAPAKPTRHTAVPAKPHVQAKIKPAVAAALSAGLPVHVAKAFARHKVVVVELYSAEAPIDKLALTEAKAGARAAGAGFVAIDVTAKKDAATRKLMTKLGLLEAPGLLVFRWPGELTVRIDGFSDSETVAQAAANAAAGTAVAA